MYIPKVNIVPLLELLQLLTLFVGTLTNFNKDCIFIMLLGDGDDDDDSIQFNSLLFMCRVNSYKANYRHSTA
jgi:hypothetical protein